MSSTENHNGAAPHANGIKSGGTVAGMSVSSTTTSLSAASAAASTGPVGIRASATVPTNSSFLYGTTNPSANRDKPRQAPPPTLPKYTSSFNAGSNGTAERLSRERESGGSYRLASLDRLALRQRILDGEKANGGDPNSVRLCTNLKFTEDGEKKKKKRSILLPRVYLFCLCQRKVCLCSALCFFCERKVFRTAEARAENEVVETRSWRYTCR